MTRNNSHPSASSASLPTSTSSSSSEHSSSSRKARFHKRFHSASSELRDLASPLRPNWIIPCPITTIHPQLRDLITCPRERGRVYYVRDKGVGEVTVNVDRERRRVGSGRVGVGRREREDGMDVEDGWKERSREDRDGFPDWVKSSPSENEDDDDEDDQDEDEDEDEDQVDGVIGRTGMAGTGTGNITGNNHSNRYSGIQQPMARHQTFCDLTFTPNCLTASSRLLACGGQTGELYITTLPTTSPSSSSSSSRSPQTPTQTNLNWSLQMTLPHTSINNSFLLLPPYSGHTPLPTRPNTPPNSSNSHRHAGTSASGVGIATYPNTLPSAPRHRFGFAGGSASARDGSEYGIHTTHDNGTMDPRASSSLAHADVHSLGHAHALAHAHFGTDDGTGLSFTDLQAAHHAGRPIPIPNTTTTGRSTVVSSSTVSRHGLTPPTTAATGSPEETMMFDDAHIWRDAPSQSSRPAPSRSNAIRISSTSSSSRFPSSTSSSSLRSGGATTSHSHPYPRPPIWASAAVYPSSQFNDDTLDSFPPGTGAGHGVHPHADEPRMLVSNNDQSVKFFAIRKNGSGSGSGFGSGSGSAFASSTTRWGETPQQVASRKLARIGGIRLETAVNHSSVSPDGKIMLAVGDTNDVYLYEVIGGGRDFRKIGVYKGSNDAGFSTAWSKDGRKFAVASQDGQVTVWDHRSSKPLAYVYTTPVNQSSTSLTGNAASYWDEINNDGYPDVYYSPPPEDRDRERRRIGEASTERIRRDPARVVKFSPEGSSRDLLVFTEEMDNIHIVDARTFDTQETVTVPFRMPEANGNPPTQRLTRLERVRQAVQNGSGRVGISGLSFDPTGDYLYTGTEATLVEFDLRSIRKRGMGCSSVA